MRFLKSPLFYSLTLGLVLSVALASPTTASANEPAHTASQVVAEGHATGNDTLGHATPEPDDANSHGEAAPEGAAHGGDDAHASANPLRVNIGEAIWNLIVFVLLLALLAKFVLPAIRDGLNAREQKLRGDLTAAEQAKAQAQAALTSVDAKLAEARKDAQAIVAEARTTAQQAANADRAKIEADIAQMKDNAQRDIAAAREQAMTDIYTQAAGLSTAIAGKILRREINADDQQSLVSESVEQFKNNASTN